MVNDIVAAQGIMEIVAGDTKSEQQGILRVNCLDCCDRTNIIQARISIGVVKNYMLEGRSDVSCAFSPVIHFLYVD